MSSAAEGASPYSTGGGGVRLEHRYAAALLVTLLTGDPIGELGDDAIPTGIRLQASDVSPIDDVVVEGSTPDGGIRRVSIGVRRNPRLTRTESATVPLVGTFLQVVINEWQEVTSGRRRVALAVSAPNTAATQTGQLATIARSVRSASEFREAVARSGATNRGVRSRLAHLDALVALSVEAIDTPLTVPASELTWRWLSALWIRQLRLEGADEQDRTVAVATLRRELADGSADAAFAAIAERAGEWASTGARVDAAMVRRALTGFPLRRSPRHTQAWSVLDGLAQRLRNGVRPDLSTDGMRLELDRAAERARLVAAMTDAAERHLPLVVTGEPDVGKSALTLRAAEQLAAGGAAVMSLSLRDLPSMVVEVEQLLGASVEAVLAATDVRPLRLLVVDGAEAVLEGRRDLLRELTVSALRAGIGVVAVTRVDGAGRVTETLRAASSVAASSIPAELVVSRLTPSERQTLAETFNSLARVNMDAHADWLVGRPGLVDVLLRAGTVVETSTLLSEADVFVAVWNGLVRSNEERADGVAPDDREHAMLAVAYRALGLPARHAPAGRVWAALRSDGLLRAPASPALSTGDEFATDLIRDFALCRLFFTDWASLRDAGAPRWTIRAVRLACQAKLLAGERNSAWQALRTVFGELSAAEGERWAEVPVEALLTLGDARQAIEAVWDDLTADNRSGLKTLIRLARQRYAVHGFGDPFALAPVVEVTFCGGHDLGQDERHSYRRGTGEAIRELVLEWLRGLVQHGEGPNKLRQRVRDRITAAGPPGYDEFAVEALATLGPDLNEEAEAFLRQLSADDPYHLGPAVESSGAVLSMPESRPELMLDLAEAYYIDRPDERDDHRFGSRLEREGIRDHQVAFRGVGAPFAGWYFGPFWRLLNVKPVETVAMINRMLDYAAECRVQLPLRRWGRDLDDPGEIFGGLDLDLPDIGPRRYIGDEHVWGWYRGSTVGPYSCMSALLAVERFADHLIGALGIPPAPVVQLLLRECHNLAMPGLVVGLLARHLDKAADLLDPWLTHPEVWSLEFARATGEGHLHVQGPDPDDLIGRDMRSRTPRDLGAEMTLRAMIAGDQARLDALATVADQLLANAQAALAQDPDPQDRIVVVEGWASVFRPDNYHARRTPDNSIAIQYEPPAPLAEALAPTAAEFDVANQALRLQMTYAARNDSPEGWPTDTLLADLELAQQFAADPPARGPLHPEDPVAAVAAAATVSHAAGRVQINDDDLRWSAEVLIAAALNPRVDFMSYESTAYSMAADRAAARALPSLLLEPFDHLGFDKHRVNEALTALATSVFNEVRSAFVAGAAPVWEAPCDSSRSCMRHASLWDAVVAGLSDCRLGPFDHESQSRPHLYLAPPYPKTLPEVPTKDLLVYRLATPIACTVAAQATSCLTAETRSLLSVLLDAHRRATDHWMTKGYGGYEDAQRELVTRALIDLVMGGEADGLVKHLHAFASNANALQHLLRDLALLFTYDDSLRPSLRIVWPLVLATVLDAIEAGADLRGNRHWVDYAIGGLLPTPQLRMGDRDPDATLDHARTAWLQPQDLEGLIDRWIVLAVGEPKAADAVAQFARTTQFPWQVSSGLEWLERVIDGRYDEFANRCWFVTNWLTELRETTSLDAAATVGWRRVVDGLAAAGDSRAVDLQRIDE